MVHLRAGQVGQQHAEGDGQQQQGLELLDDGQVEQHAGDENHHQRLPVAREQLHKARLIQKIDNRFHTLSSAAAYFSVHRTAPEVTEAPLVTVTEVTVPSVGAMISFSIFMASRTSRTWPFLTA